MIRVLVLVLLLGLVAAMFTKPSEAVMQGAARVALDDAIRASGQPLDLSATLEGSDDDNVLIRERSFYYEDWYVAARYSASIDRGTPYVSCVGAFTTVRCDVQLAGIVVN